MEAPVLLLLDVASFTLTNSKTEREQNSNINILTLYSVRLYDEKN